jgi:hypothetical protein
LVVEVNDINSLDFSNSSSYFTWVLYGNNGDDYGATFKKWYLSYYNYATFDGWLAAGAFEIENNAGIIIGTGVGASGTLDISGLWMTVYGKCAKNVAIDSNKPPAKYDVPRTLKGNVNCTNVWLIGGSDYNKAIGVIQLTLDSKYTKFANTPMGTPPVLPGLLGVKTKITDDLEGKGYTLLVP